MGYKVLRRAAPQSHGVTFRFNESESCFCICLSGKQREQHRGVCGAGLGVSDGLTNPVLGELAEGLETPVQALYLVTLLGFLVVGAYLVVRQVGAWTLASSHVSLKEHCLLSKGTNRTLKILPYRFEYVHIMCIIFSYTCCLQVLM